MFFFNSKHKSSKTICPIVYLMFKIWMFNKTKKVLGPNKNLGRTLNF